MEHVSSADGTRIAFEREGNGPPLLIAVGAFCTRASGASLAAALAERFTVVRYDRRGRGDSDRGDGSLEESVAREVEDLEAVATACGEAVFAYGHSSGGSLALEAAARGVALRRIAAYEPPYSGAGSVPEGFAEELDALARGGQEEEAAARFLQLTGAPPPVIDGIKASPGWPDMVRLAPTLPRDMALGNDGAVPTQRLASIAVPVLALAGDASGGWAQDAARSVAASTPHGEARTLDGQHHNVADEVLLPVLEAWFA